MPTYQRSDDKPVVHYDPRIEVSPFLLFKRLRENRGPRLIDVRASPSGRTLRGAESVAGAAWRPQPDEEVLLFDEDGSEALRWVERLQAEGFARVKMLFGGLDLYEFSLDPEVVGHDTFLETE
jgi:hypothetical protein